MDEQEKRLELHRRLAEERPVLWDNLPDISLYMDQVISYLPRQLIRFDEGEKLTSAMVNNYSKEGLIPRAEGKKYGRTHLVYLSAICALKQVLSVREIRTLLSDTGGDNNSEEFYARFCAVLDAALAGTADKVTATNSNEELSLLALELALESYSNKLACQRILSILKEKDLKSEKGKK